MNNLANSEGSAPIPSDAQASQLEKIAAEMRKTLKKDQDDAEADDHDQSTGPLRDMINRQDSLYKYLTWEDPIRTLGSYFLALGVISAAHFLPWTKTALKYASILLGVVSVTELANRVFTENTLLARARPKKYKKLPERTLNATLRDVHDLLQHLTVMAQKTMLGEDLSSTFILFATLTALYWFSNLLSPFGLAIASLTTAYIVPLFNSPQGKKVARDAQVQAEKLGTTAVENSKHLAHQGQEKLSEDYSKAQSGVAATRQYAGETVASGKQSAADMSGQAKDAAISGKDQAADAMQRGGQVAADASNKAADATVNTKNQAADALHGGKEAVVDGAPQAQEAGRQAVQGDKQGAGQQPQSTSFGSKLFGSGKQRGGQTHEAGKDIKSVQNVGGAQGSGAVHQAGGYQHDLRDVPEEILDHSKVQSTFKMD